MDKVLRIRKNSIAIVVILLLIICGFGAYNIRAAERIDTTEDITITANVAAADNSIFAEKYKGDLTVKLYKIATVDETGKATAATGYENIDFTVLDGSPTVSDVNTKIVDPAVAIAKTKNEPDKTITITRPTENSDSVEIENGAGIYLYIIDTFISGQYEYTFTPYILVAPTNAYFNGGETDEWLYDVSFNIKSSAEEKFGDLEIVKKVDTFNLSLGSASFVYKVVAKLDDETVLNNVYMLTLDESGETSRVIPDIPASAKVTVTEIYKGASYDSVGEEVVDGLVIAADDTVKAEFENDYNDKTIVGGIGVENQFVNEDGEVIWIDPNPVLELR